LLDDGPHFYRERHDLTGGSTVTHIVIDGRPSAAAEMLWRLDKRGLLEEPPARECRQAGEAGLSRFPETSETIS